MRLGGYLRTVRANELRLGLAVNLVVLGFGPEVEPWLHWFGEGEMDAIIFPCAAR